MSFLIGRWWPWQQAVVAAGNGNMKRPASGCTCALSMIVIACFTITATGFKCT